MKQLEKAKKLARKSATVIALATSVALGASTIAGLAYFVGQEHGMQTERAQAYGRFGTEVHALARALVGEAKGQPEEWRQMTSAIFNRVTDPRWPDTIEEVLKQCSAKKGCQIVAMGDAVPEMMTGPVGIEALTFAYTQVQAYHAGTFVPLNEAHSWATPKAAKGHRYFEGLELVAEFSGHQYFGGEYQEEMSTSNLAPKMSLRPQLRPGLDSMAAAIAASVRLAQE